jgi:hypothetical protein
MVSPDTSRRLWSLGLFALPLVAAKLAAIMLGGSSQRAGAAPHPGPIEVAPVVTAGDAASKIEWTVAQTVAAQHVASLSSQSFGPSPMLHVPAPEPVESVAVQPDPPPVIIEPEPEPAPEPDPVFVLQALMEAPNGNKALINGRAYARGEPVDEGRWVVRHINVGERNVTLQNIETHAIIVVFVQRPR